MTEGARGAEEGTAGKTVVGTVAGSAGVLAGQTGEERVAVKGVALEERLAARSEEGLEAAMAGETAGRMAVAEAVATGADKVEEMAVGPVELMGVER